MCDTPYVGSRQHARFWNNAKNLEHMLTKIFSALLLKANLSPCSRQLNPNMSKSHISAMCWYTSEDTLTGSELYMWVDLKRWMTRAVEVLLTRPKASLMEHNAPHCHTASHPNRWDNCRPTLLHLCAYFTWIAFFPKLCVLNRLFKCCTYFEVSA